VEDQIRVVELGELERRTPVGSLGDHLEPTGAFEHQPEEQPQILVVVDDQGPSDHEPRGHEPVRRSPPGSIWAVEATSSPTSADTRRREDSRPRSSGRRPCSVSPSSMASLAVASCWTT
jgi:hypothetical protein